MAPYIASSGYHTLISLAAISTLFLLAGARSLLPSLPEPVEVQSSLASLTGTVAERVQRIYRDDLYEGGGEVSLPHGRVRYWLIGREKGPKVVLIHGLTFPSVIWRDVVPRLAAAGFRVLVYDLYGRGYSDAPRTAYDAGLYTTQLALLMQAVGWEQAHIVGFSMGGGIAASFAANFPHLTTGKVVLIASAGLAEFSGHTRAKKLIWSSVIRHAVASSPIQYLLPSSSRSFSTSESSSGSLREIVQLQSAYLPGYDLAVASSIRDGPLRGLEPDFAKLDAMNTALLLIWGTDDNIVPFKNARKMQGIVPPPKSTLVAIEGGRHDIPVTHADEISRSLVEFLSEGSA